MGAPRQKFEILKVSEAAAARIKEILQASSKPLAGVRVGVKNAGCAGMAYTLDTVETPDKGDDLVADQGVNVYIDPAAVMFLLGAKMDFQSDKLRSGFVFENPNEVSACGCGESVQLKPAEEREP